jgi:peptidyl-prolyl cis-trans isomerase SurA
MEIGEITKPMPYRTADGKDAFRIVFFKSKFAPHEANLKDDYQKIYNACLLQKKQIALRNWFEKSRTEVYVEVDPQYKNCELFKDGI